MRILPPGTVALLALSLGSVAGPATAQTQAQAQTTEPRIETTDPAADTAMEPPGTLAPDGAVAETDRAPTDELLTGRGGTDARMVSVDALIGRAVHGADGRNLGSVEDVVVDPATGEARRILLSTAGILEPGGRTVAIDLDEVALDAETETVVLPGLTGADIQDLPDAGQDLPDAGQDLPDAGG